jgi:hypothetical protein
VLGRSGGGSKKYGERSNIEVSHFQGMVLDEITPWFNLVSHERREHVIGNFDIIDFHLNQGTVGRIHGGIPERFRIHFPQSFVPLEMRTFEGFLPDHFDQSMPGPDLDDCFLSRDPGE